MWNFKMLVTGVISFLRYLGLLAWGMICGQTREAPPRKTLSWWQRPGVGVLFMTDQRKGWNWDRDYNKFNRSISDDNGNLEFNGPFCRTDEWVAFSREAGLDYHIFQAKWHDGICFFDTRTTAWKTPQDYARKFADKSREAGIPFLFYYSSVFDHNPQFDAIQPNPHATPSLIGNKPEYQDYLRRQYGELITQYQPDGLWLDWYWAEGSTPATIRHLRAAHPERVIAFNLSNLFPSAFGKIDFTSSEAHCYSGPLVRFRKEATLYVPVLTSAVLWSNLFRLVYRHPWELCTPTGKWWVSAGLRDDQLELLRSLAVILANGGKIMIGVAVQMDGSLAPTHVDQFKLLGDWYKPRKALFREARPIRYRWLTPPGVRVRSKGVDLVASRYGDGKLLHIIRRKKEKTDMTVELRGSMWREVRRAALMPEGRELAVHSAGKKRLIRIPAADVDPVDTILYLEN